MIRNNPSPYLIDYLEVQGVFLPKELQNMAGEPYTDAESMKASAEANSKEDVNHLSQGVNTLENSVNSINNSLNSSNQMGNVFNASLSNVSEDKSVENLFE